MAFDVYPRQPSAPLSLAKGLPSALIPFTERVAIDPLTGRNTMYVALVKLGPDCAVPGPPDPVIRLQVDTGPVMPIGVETPLFADPDSVDPLAIATLTKVNDVYLVELEVLESGGSWSLQVEHAGPMGTHEFTWAVADRKTEMAQPWINTSPVAVDFVVTNGQKLSKTVSIANLGTGPLTFTDPGGKALGQGFVLDSVNPPTIGPHGCATATITFTGPDVPGASGTDFLVASNDAAAGTQPGHSRMVKLTAATNPAPPAPVVASVDVGDSHPGGQFTIIGEHLVLEQGDDVSISFTGPLHPDNPFDPGETLFATVVQPTVPGLVRAIVPEISSHNDHEEYSVTLARTDGQAVTVSDEFFVAIL